MTRKSFHAACDAGHKCTFRFIYCREEEKGARKLKERYEHILQLVKEKPPGIWITALLFLAVAFFLGKSLGENAAAAVSGDNAAAIRTADAVLYAENWGLGFGRDGTCPTGTATAEELAEYDAYYVADTEEKIIYLTFDCGYENGNTGAILDALKKHGAPATFFVVGHYLESAPELVKRMVEEGHSVGNHTYHHPDMTAISDKAAFQKEMDDVKTLFKEITEEELAMYYRPPQGKYSMANLQLAKELGYSTYFWSLAYVDWNVDAQPSHEDALDKLTRRVHPGAIVLLHTTSKTNGEIMDELLTKWEEMGYTFGRLEDVAGDY